MRIQLFSVLLMLAGGNQASAADSALFTVPFATCSKDFGTGSDTWYICSDIEKTFLSNAIFTTENVFIQSLPIKNVVSLSFTCRTSQNVTADLSILDSQFPVLPSNLDQWKSFEKSMSYAEAGTENWTVSVKFLESEFNSVKAGCGVKVLQNVSQVATKTLSEYVKFRTKLTSDLGEVIESLSKVSAGSVSEVKVALDGAIKNIETVLSRPLDPLQKLLLNQTKSNLVGMLNKISTACTVPSTDGCKNELDKARTKTDGIMSENSDELESIKTFLEGEKNRVKDIDASYQAILDGILSDISPDA